MRKCIFITLLFTILSSSLFCQSEKPINKSEVLGGVKIEYEKISFFVYSSGYTDKSSFNIKIDNKKGVYEIELFRVKADPGKMMPELIEIIFPKEELDRKVDFRKKIIIKNSFSSIGIY